MPMSQYIVIAGSVALFLGSLSYTRDTLRGVVQPNRATWLLWAISPIIGAVAAYVDGVRWAALPVLVAGLCPLMVFAASFVNKNAYWKLHRFDYLCAVFSVLALILWALTNDPLVAIVFAIASDGLASLPTITKAWTHPESESGAPYWTSALAALTSFTVITNWEFSEYGFPLYLVVANAAVLIALYRHGRTTRP
jgi:hypothetical protein